MTKHEAQFTTEFLTWARHNLPFPTVFEIKHTRGKQALALSELKDHQRDALKAAKHGKFTHKIRDTGYLNPFDAVLFTGMDAYLVIKYPDFFVGIDIDNVPESGTLSDADAIQKAAFTSRSLS